MNGETLHLFKKNYTFSCKIPGKGFIPKIQLSDN